MAENNKNRQSKEGLSEASKKYMTEEDVVALVQTLLLDSQQVIRIKSGWMQSRNYATNTKGWKADANGGLEVEVISYANLGSTPAGPSEVGDTCVVSGKLRICTVAGTPGTWAIVGTQS